MAVTRDENVILMTADADEVEDKLYIQGLYATGAVAAIVNSDDGPIAAFGAEGGMQFPCKILASGIKRGAGAGSLYVYIV